MSYLISYMICAILALGQLCLLIKMFPPNESDNVTVGIMFIVCFIPILNSIIAFGEFIGLVLLFATSNGKYGIEDLGRKIISLIHKE